MEKFFGRAGERIDFGRPLRKANRTWKIAKYFISAKFCPAKRMFCQYHKFHHRQKTEKQIKLEENVLYWITWRNKKSESEEREHTSKCHDLIETVRSKTWSNTRSTKLSKRRCQTKDSSAKLQSLDWMEMEIPSKWLVGDEHRLNYEKERQFAKACRKLEKKLWSMNNSRMQPETGPESQPNLNLTLETEWTELE